MSDMTTIPPCQMTRELRLRLALARLIPDEIEITDLNNFKWKCGELAGKMLRDSEWLYVVNLVDATLGEVEPDDWHVLAELSLSMHGIEWDTPCSPH